MLDEQPIVLGAGGVTLVVVVSGESLPRVVHWGGELGELVRVASATAVPLLPSQATGYSGRPALAGSRDGTWPYARLRPLGRPDVDGSSLLARSADDDAGVEVESHILITADGVIKLRHTVHNSGSDVYQLDTLRCVLPIPDDAAELIDFTGRWALERVPQRGPFRHGAHVRELRRGRTGFDAPTLLCAGTAGFGFRRGEVWAVHVGWSGNHEHSAERSPASQSLLGGGELFESGEMRLPPGGSYTTPWVYFAWSDAGLDGISARVHQMLRSRPSHPRTPRPLTLNTWEAVYFDHDVEKLRTLASTAAGVGVERFVLDDGWFGSRRDDTSGLGDWYVDPTNWPEGLHPLTDHVRGLGMQFGLWIEPEMVNPDSELARAHPDWILAAPGRWPVDWRNQQVLDVARPEASAYLLERLDALVAEYGIDYIKWDHNRDLLEAVHEGSAAVHAQTMATYALIDELRSRHPSLEIESCSSGGARVDLGILERADRVWASDTNDPIDRQRIQRGTSLLLPLELIGCHVGPATAHVTGRTTSLRLRCATALFGHAGIEWDITTCDESELAQLAEWIALYKRARSLLHSGVLVRADLGDETALLHGVVAADSSHALFAYVQLASPLASRPVRVRLPGLDPERSYLVAQCAELATTSAGVTAPGPLSGTALERLGVEVVLPRAGDVLLLEVSAAAGT
jgi:alpha-galactosidase